MAKRHDRCLSESYRRRCAPASIWCDRFWFLPRLQLDFLACMNDLNGGGAEDFFAGQLPITKTSAELNNHVPYHCRSRSSEQKPGPMAASRPIAPGSGQRCFITSSSTTSTEAEERFPTLRRQSQEASSCPLCNPSAVAQASSTFGPPVCRTQL